MSNIRKKLMEERQAHILEINRQSPFKQITIVERNQFDDKKGGNAMGPNHSFMDKKDSSGGKPEEKYNGDIVSIFKLQ